MRVTNDFYEVNSAASIGVAENPNSAVQQHAPLVARLHDINDEGKPLVTGIPQLPGKVVLARAMVDLAPRMVGHMVVLMFEHGDPMRPIVIGVLQPEASDAATRPDRGIQALSVEADGQRVVIDAEREIVLRCGEASITLTRQGKVIIQGNYVVSRSRGYNKIKGAAVDIN